MAREWRFNPFTRKLERNSVDGGGVSNYVDGATSVAWSSGAATVNYSTCNNVLRLSDLTQNTTLTLSNLVANKGLYATVEQDGNGPWTLDIGTSGNEVEVTINDTGKTVLYIDYDGTDLICQDMSSAGLTVLA